MGFLLVETGAAFVKWRAGGGRGKGVRAWIGGLPAFAPSGSACVHSSAGWILTDIGRVPLAATSSPQFVSPGAMTIPHEDRLRAALADRYAIQREIGQGGMATVYLADDLAPCG